MKADSLLHSLTVMLLLASAACSSLPDISHRVETYKMSDTGDTRLAAIFQQAIDRHSGMTAVHPLVSGTDAFLARAALIKMAERSLDLQYYIWNRDATGRLLAAYVLEAAERGVRVRILLDDLGSPVGDDHLLALSRHPNIRIRLFNPAADRDKGVIGLAADFNRVNRRMHNKSLTADNVASIVGGRNVGDEYFDADSELGFSDLDVLAVGSIVDEVSDSFDLYWNFETSFPIESLSSVEITPDDLARRYAGLKAIAGEGMHTEYIERLRQTDLFRNTGHLDWYWGETTLVYDHPSKAQSRSPAQDGLLIDKLAAIIDDIRSELIVVSPYFVPGEQGVAFFTRLADRGVEIDIITNSLAATDVGAVHAGYAKYREELLEAGVALYEMRPDRDTGDQEKDEPDRPRYVIGSSSRASLHAKAFFFDREVAFIGSLNLDPRSLRINTEVGVVIENAALAGMASDRLRSAVRNRAYQVELDEDGDLRWKSHENGETRYYDSEPHVSVWRRLGVWFIGLFPVESQL